MKQIKKYNFTVEEIQKRVENLVLTTQKVVANQNVTDDERRKHFLDFSLSYCRTYNCLIEKSTEMNPELFRELYRILIDQRESMIEFAILKTKNKIIKKYGKEK